MTPSPAGQWLWAGEERPGSPRMLQFEAGGRAAKGGGQGIPHSSREFGSLPLHSPGTCCSHAPRVCRGATVHLTAWGSPCPPLTSEHQESRHCHWTRLPAQMLLGYCVGSAGRVLSLVLHPRRGRASRHWHVLGRPQLGEVEGPGRLWWAGWLEEETVAAE